MQTAALDVKAEEANAEAGFDPIEWVRNEESLPGIEPKQSSEEDFVVSEERVYGTDAEKSAGLQDDAVTPEESDRVVRLIDPAPGSTLPVEHLSREKTEPPKTAETASVPAREPEKRLMTEYWIQAGSYGSNSRANFARDLLAEKGITSTIQTRELESGTFFRVRIGPYMNSDEAAKFLDWVKNLDGFQESYITEVYVRK